MTFRDWKHECAKLALKVLGLEDLLDESDPYNVQDTFQESYDNEDTPEDWLREVFAEDLAKIEYDEDLHRISLEEEDDDDYNEGYDDEVYEVYDDEEEYG